MCLCHDVGCHMTFHRQSVLSPVCLKEGYCTINDTEVPLPPVPLCFLENSSRFFLLDSKSGRHALALPQPLVIAPRWTPRNFFPFLPPATNLLSSGSFSHSSTPRGTNMWRLCTYQLPTGLPPSIPIFRNQVSSRNSDIW